MKDKSSCTHLILCYTRYIVSSFAVFNQFCNQCFFCGHLRDKDRREKKPSWDVPGEKDHDLDDGLGVRISNRRLRDLLQVEHALLHRRVHPDRLRGRQNLQCRFNSEPCFFVTL